MASPSSSYTAPKRRSDRIRAYLIPVVLVCAASVQIARVHFDGLTSWRGGGFGMYAGFHPRYNDAWLLRTDTGEAIRYTQTGSNSKTPGPALTRPILKHTNERELLRAVDGLPPAWRDVARIQVWQLNFAPSTGLLTRRLLAEAPRRTDGRP